MKLKLFPELYEKNGSGDYAVKLLAGTVNISGTRKNNRKIVILEKVEQVHVAGGSGGCIRGTRRKRVVLIHKTRTGPINLGRRDMDVFSQGIQLSLLVMQPHVCHDISLVPMIRIFPTLGDHGLGGEINYIRGFETFDFLDDLIAMFV